MILPKNRGGVRGQYKISARSLHRYFESTTSLSSKKALQVLRIRKAVQQLATNPEGFRYDKYGYYDYSHFCKHLKQFLQKTPWMGYNHTCCC